MKALQIGREALIELISDFQLPLWASSLLKESLVMTLLAVEGKPAVPALATLAARVVAPAVVAGKPLLPRVSVATATCQ